jgi:Methionine biosynthesis protein MetW
MNRLALGKRCALLDVGCGPATLASLLRSDIQYYGIDIATHEPAPNLIEADFSETPIQFADKRSDIVLAQTQKFTEIAQILRDDSVFIMSYVNFDHRKKSIYWQYSNVQSFNDFHQSLAQHFGIHKVIGLSCL